MEIPRKHHLRRVRLLLREFPVVALLGARQVGKSTQVRRPVASRRGPAMRFDLHNPADLARLAGLGLALRPLRGLVVLDEIERLPDEFFAAAPTRGSASYAGPVPTTVYRRPRFEKANPTSDTTAENTMMTTATAGSSGRNSSTIMLQN